MMGKKIGTLARATAAMLAIATISPAFSQSTPKQKQAIESSAEGASQNQLGGQKRDRQISRENFRHSQNRMLRRFHHHQVQY